MNGSASRPAAAGIAFEALDASALAGEREWWGIYEGSFPPEEKEPREVILRGVRGGAAMALVAREGSRAIGMAATTLLRDPPAVFATYLAMAPFARSRGIGGSLLEFAWQVGAQRLSAMELGEAALVWEVEIPVLAGTPEDRLRRERRVEFYRRQGGVVMDLAYRQPPLAPQAAPIAMHLMYRPHRAGMVPDRAGQIALAAAIYREKYGAINLIEPGILAALLQQMAAAGGA